MTHVATLLPFLALACCCCTAVATSHRPIIILAEGRSGSSFLGQLFDADPNMRYVFEPERHASADEIAMMLRCDDALTPNVTSRLLWRCKDSSWCRSSKGVGGGSKFQRSARKKRIEI